MVRTIDANLRPENKNNGIELPAVHSIAGAKVLVVEDNKINQQIVSELLMQAGVNVTIADNGHEAVEMVFEKTFDLVLMDIHMPKLDGIETTRIIRTQDKYAELPIVAMTADAMEGDRELSMAAGMNDHITKPIDPALIKYMLIKWIKPRNMEAEYPRKSKAIAGEETLPSFKYIDADQGVKNLGGNTKLYRKILQDFAAHNKNIPAEIYREIVTGDYEKPFIAVHSIKGIAGTIGASCLYEASAELEWALRNESCDIESLYLPFKESINKVIDELQVWGASKIINPRLTNSDFNREEFQRLVEILRPMLVEGNAKAGDFIFEIVAIMESSNTVGLAHMLIEQIENMDFYEAVETLNQICAELDLPC